MIKLTDITGARKRIEIFATLLLIQDDYDLHYMLPFTEKRKISNGGQGVIWKVKIHDNHYESKICSIENQWEALGGPYFAVKEFKDEFEFKNELEASRQFSEPNTKHAHLMNVLFAFSYGSRHFLILPLAQGSLDKFWRKIDSLPRDPLFLIEQCHGISEGLQNIHDCNARLSGHNRKMVMGRHGDIKPHNILWFVDHSTTGGNRFVLSDFTLMRFHAEGANEETTLRDIGGTQTYRAPEKDIRPRGHVSPEYDVWSLGCVFLEFASCYLLGHQATYGERFMAADGQHFHSFKSVRQMDDYKEWMFPEDKYFVLSREKSADGQERFVAEIKISVKQMSREI
ncbi:hypothetical protein Daus18300_002472 [Diaporthe australafricana]|uniref:Protein kinase domain-containing protein n=1 Tax=Diaporthe australafricana TaxID=127596 RepID=A0ABR3XP26_9PEZI